jgi:transcription termination factor Rho
LNNSATPAQGEALAPIAGILDIRDNRGYVRASGYLAGPGDGHVSATQIRRYGLRRGDAVTGAVRPAANGGKHPTLARIDTVNGLDPREAAHRPDFYDFTPLNPNEQLRLETTPDQLITRTIDLMMPIGKGQRALIVSPPKAGKTMILQAIAQAISRNHPECHLMAVLVDERPEEVTDMRRSIDGEVVYSTFDRPAADHLTVAELSLEHAKRRVELGQDVVVLLDSLTRLGRAYNNAAPASGRILSGGIDASALHRPKKLLGAARNLENGGSLTIIATTLVETGSTGDTVIFEEYKSTGNAELRLDRRLADKRVYPAVDIAPSGTRREELLLDPAELAVVRSLRAALAAMDSRQAMEHLLTQLRRTGSNAEFLLRMAQSTGLPAAA